MPGLRSVLALVVAGVTLAACSSSGSTPAPTAAATVTPTAAGSAAASAASSGSGASAAASSNPAMMAPITSLDAKSVGSLGTVLVASSGFTVYTFSKDTKDSNKSACTGGCLTKWPAVTVASDAPTAGSGVSGKLGTFTRADNSAVQVTYNGLPLYYFSGDAKPGDGNGVYTNWAAVTP